MRPQLSLPALVLIAASLACAGRVFETTHIYSLSEMPFDEAYDSASGTILADNVWVFRPDGTFEAYVPDCATQPRMSGSYSGDNVGSEFLFMLDLDEDGQTDDQVQLDVENDEYASIQWNCHNQELTFFLLR